MIKAFVIAITAFSISSLYIQKESIIADSIKKGNNADGKKLNVSLQHFAQSDDEDEHHELDNADQKFFLVNFQGYDVKIHKLALTGRGDKNQYVSKFKLEASFDGEHFFPVNGGRAYDGNNDCKRKIETYFYKGLPAKILKFIPCEYSGDISFKLDLVYEFLSLNDVYDDTKDKIFAKNDGKDYSQTSLFEKIGGEAALIDISKNAFNILRSNAYFSPRLNKYANYLSKNLFEYLQVLLGGPKSFQGHDCAINLNYFFIEKHYLDFFINSVLLAFKNGCNANDELLELIKKQLYFNKDSIIVS